MKVIVIGGYPGSGKSTIVRRVLEELTKQGYKFLTYKFEKYVTYLRSEQGLIVLGTYGKNEDFPGTDRFAMNAQPEAMAFLEEFRDITHNEYTVLFEGDRLFNAKMLDWLKDNGFSIVLCIVETHWAKLETRRNARSNQSETWRKGRHTKVDRIIMKYGVNHKLLNNTVKEQDDSVRELIQEIKGEWDKDPAGKTIKDFWK